MPGVACLYVKSHFNLNGKKITTTAAAADVLSIKDKDYKIIIKNHTYVASAILSFD